MSPESEKIVKALRDVIYEKEDGYFPIEDYIHMIRAADHIEQLEREKAEAKRQGFAEGLELAANHAAYFDHDVARGIRALEESHAEEEEK